MVVMANVDTSPERIGPGSPGVADPELVRRSQLGSVAAFEQLVLAFGPGVHRFLALRLRNDADARDALQETLAAAWQGLPSLEDPLKFRSWLLGIAAHKAADVMRRSAPAAEAELDRRGREDDSLLELREAILALPAQFRDVLLLRYLLQLSEGEAATALGVRVGTVKSRTARARAALLEVLR